MRIKQMTTKHIENRIVYLKRFLDTRPNESVYMGNSVYAEDAVDQENRQNEIIAEDISEDVEYLEKELISRNK